MTRFLCDVMCGKLAVYLRFCGHDTAYALDHDAEADDRLLALADAEGRTVVTRDRQLATRAANAILLRSRDVTDQLRELRDAGVELSSPEAPRYCGQCNGRLDSLAATASPEVRPEYVPDDPPGGNLYRCRDCGQWFWKGSHWARMRATLEGL
jgi:uncharacterized protein with PIN domain